MAKKLQSFLAVEGELPEDNEAGGLAHLDQGRAAPVGGIPKALGEAVAHALPPLQPCFGNLRERRVRDKPKAPAASAGAFENSILYWRDCPVGSWWVCRRRARESTWLQRQSEPQSERFSIRPVWRAQAVLRCELFGGSSRYEHDKYAHRRSQPPILPGRSSRCPAIKGDVYPGYGPAFTVTVYLFSSAQSSPGSRSLMTTVPSRQPTRLNLASTLIRCPE